VPSCDVITHDRRRDVELVGDRRGQLDERCNTQTYHRPRRRDVELVGGRRGRGGVGPHTHCCWPPCFTTGPPECATDSAALYEYTYATTTTTTTTTPDYYYCPAGLYEYTYAQRSLGVETAADKRLRPSPRYLVREGHVTAPPLLPPPPPVRDPALSESLAWTRLGSVEHDVCPHVTVHCTRSQLL